MFTSKQVFKIKKNSRKCACVTTIRSMEALKQITVRDIRRHAEVLAGDWIACEVASGAYTLQCGQSVLYTINTGKPRLFRTLDAVKLAMQQEIGITEFKVETLKT